MTRFPRLAPVVLALLATLPSARADLELLPPDRSIAEAVDFYIDTKLAAERVAPAPPADDASLIRRLTLDLAGRIPIPTDAERADALASNPEKRRELVDRLLASPGYVRHQARELDALLMTGAKGSLLDYLTRAVADDRPWDQIFRELMLADESQSERKGAAEYLKRRINDLDRLTSDVSSTFFGVDVSCAKCHDHPRVVAWKQDHYYGMKSFFARSYDAGAYVGENDYGGVKFQTTEGVERQARLMFLTGRMVDAPATAEPSKEEIKEAKRRIAEAKKQRVPPPAPRFSVRAQLVDVALQPSEREFFARAVVNRVWHRLFGTGLVMPLDQMHAANPPSHPELLAWLARDLADHRYDLRRLIRGLVLSRAYARDSRWPEGAEPASTVDPRLFSVAPVRPLTPWQLAASTWVATADPAALTADSFETQLESRARPLAAALARPGEDYQIGVSEALLLSNGDRLNEWLSAQDGRLVGRLAQLKEHDAQVALAVRQVLSRPPLDDEISHLGDYLAQRDDRPNDALRQLVWALLTSSEFRFNH